MAVQHMAVSCVQYAMCAVLNIGFKWESHLSRIKMGDGGAAEKLGFGKMMSTGSMQVENRVGGSPLEMY